LLGNFLLNSSALDGSTNYPNFPTQGLSVLRISCVLTPIKVSVSLVCFDGVFGVKFGFLLSFASVVVLPLEC